MAPFLHGGGRCKGEQAFASQDQGYGGYGNEGGGYDNQGRAHAVDLCPSSHICIADWERRGGEPGVCQYRKV